MQIIPHLAALRCVLTMQISAMSACVQNRAIFVLTSTYFIYVCVCVFSEETDNTLHYFISHSLSLWKIVQFMFYIRAKRRAEGILMALYQELKLIEKVNFINRFFPAVCFGSPSLSHSLLLSFSHLLLLAYWKYCL